MTKYRFLFLLLIAICMVSFSCNTSKITYTMKLNDIDSAIRTIVPSHNCNCKWENKEIKIPRPRFVKNMYGWQGVFAKNIDTVEKVENSKKIFLALLNLNKNYSDYETYFLEYLKPNLNDSTKPTVVGTWFYIKNGCEGYAEGITKDSMITLTKDNKIRKKLCEL